MASRVRRPSRYDDMLNNLVGRGSGTSKEKSIFPTLKDALLFAACLGHKRRNRVPFKKHSEPIDLSVFSSDFNMTTIFALAVAEESRPVMLSDEAEGERLQIFEEYACGGLEILHNEIWEAGRDWEKGLLRLILEEESGDTILRDITGLASS